MTAAFGYLFNELMHQTTKAQQAYGRTEVYLDFKNVPGGDGMGYTDPSAFPQHAYLRVVDTLTGDEWISRAGPGGPGSGLGFGTIRAVTTLNTPGSTLDYGAKANATYLLFNTDESGSAVASNLARFSNSYNKASLVYNPLSQNSNTYAFDAGQMLTGSRFRPFVIFGGQRTIHAPGSQ